MPPPHPPLPSYVDLEIGFAIYNPNVITATLDCMDYTIYANDIAIGSGEFSERTDIPPGATERVTMLYRADMSTVPEVLISAVTEGEVTWKISGTAYIGPLTIPFERIIAQI